MVRTSGKIRRILVDAGLVTDEDWAAARERGQPVSALISQGILTEAKVFETLGLAAGIPPVDLSRIKPDPSALECLAQEVCVEHGILPLSKNGDILTVAISDPFDVLMLDDLRRLARCQVRPVFSHAGAIKHATEAIYDRGKQQVDELLGQVNTNEIEVRVEEEPDLIDAASVVGDDAPAIKVVNLALLKALKEKASDIHIEPGEQAVRVRYRVDGALYDVMRPPTTMLPALISRLKIMASLDIAERFAPQDGKFQIRFENRKIDFRLSILPVVGGEKAVLRILDTGSMGLKLDSLGYEPKAQEDIRYAIGAAYGMLLLTGPTGSGKSTTLYSCVKEVATPDLNVVTVEDPVEYRMDGINQVPVNPKRGMTFAGALRSILRQDPDVILVGEIRDLETADIAIKAALTGHLVLSTLHTNDAATTVTRLLDMGIDPFMVSSSLLCVGAQRLARKLCTQCRVRIEVPEEELLSMGYEEGETPGIELWGPNPGGCQRCKEGYKGRFAILETLALTQELKRMVVERRSAQDIKDVAVRNGMLTLRRVGLLNAARGKTSLEEVLRTTLDDKS